MKPPRGGNEPRCCHVAAEAIGFASPVKLASVGSEGQEGPRTFLCIRAADWRTAASLSGLTVEGGENMGRGPGDMDGYKGRRGKREREREGERKRPDLDGFNKRKR